MAVELSRVTVAREPTTSTDSTSQGRRLMSRATVTKATRPPMMGAVTEVSPPTDPARAVTSWALP